jgi:hypothetical protein
MICSKCKTGNLDEANFCRVCGYRFFKLSRVLLSSDKQPDYQEAMKDLFTSFGLFVIALITFLSAAPIWLGFIFAGIVALLKGCWQLLQVKVLTTANHPQIVAAPTNSLQEITSSFPQDDFRPQTTAERLSPPSVTENTTKLFDR